MKKILCVGLIAVSLMGLVGCGASDKQQDDNVGVNVESSNKKPSKVDKSKKPIISSQGTIIDIGDPTKAQFPPNIEGEMTPQGAFINVDNFYRVMTREGARIFFDVNVYRNPENVTPLRELVSKRVRPSDESKISSIGSPLEYGVSVDSVREDGFGIDDYHVIYPISNDYVTRGVFYIKDPMRGDISFTIKQGDTYNNTASFSISKDKIKNATPEEYLAIKRAQFIDEYAPTTKATFDDIIDLDISTTKVQDDGEYYNFDCIVTNNTKQDIVAEGNEINKFYMTPYVDGKKIKSSFFEDRGGRDSKESIANRISLKAGESQTFKYSVAKNQDTPVDMNKVSWVASVKRYVDGYVANEYQLTEEVPIAVSN